MGISHGEVMCSLFLFLWSCTTQKEYNFDYEVQDQNPQEDTDVSEVSNEPESQNDTEEPSQPETAEPEQAQEDSAVVEVDCGPDSTGSDVGECAYNFALMNENDNMTALYDFYGDVVFLDLSSFT